MLQNLSRREIRLLPKLLRSHDSRKISHLKLLRARWRPSPIPAKAARESRDARDHQSTRGAPHEEGEIRDPDFIRRGRTGLIVAIGITAVNGYVWYNWQLAGSAAKRGETRLLDLMKDHFMCSRRNYNEGRWWTVVTAGFSHVEIWHILANTIGLVSFYPAVAGRLGVIPSALGYLACIAGGSAASLYHAGEWQETYQAPAKDRYFSAFSIPRPEKPDVPGLGASAGVFGIFTLSVLIAPTAGVSIFFIPLPAWLAWGLLTGVDSYCALSQDGRQRMTEVTGIQMGHEAHLGGSATALVASFLLMPRFWFRR